MSARVGVAVLALAVLGMGVFLFVSLYSSPRTAAAPPAPAPVSPSSRADSPWSAPAPAPAESPPVAAERPLPATVQAAPELPRLTLPPLSPQQRLMPHSLGIQSTPAADDPTLEEIRQLRRIVRSKEGGVSQSQREVDDARKRLNELEREFKGRELAE